MKIMYLFICLFIGELTYSEMVITYRAPESENDTRFDYPLELIVNAMDKTLEEYGSYKLVKSPSINFIRARSVEYISQFENFLFETTATNEDEEHLLSIKIPIAKGIYGYRIFLINILDKKKFEEITTLDELKNISFGQGRGWNDTNILESHGFNVVTGGTYEGLFKMLSGSRFDAFPRGVNEVFQEYESRKDEISNIIVEETICLYYPLPRFFYTTKNNTLLAERLTKGLTTMIEDGSFDVIWKKHNIDYINNAKLSSRKIFKIDNLFIPDVVPLDDPKYWFTVD